MDQLYTNPFDLIRASDFSDNQIIDLWVDFTGPGGLVSLLEPTARTSKHILGGKGSGKTHLMRYCSYSVQKIRHHEALLTGIREDRYVGVFLRANTLDTGRFQGKGQPEERWGSLFNYYFEICIVEQLLAIVSDIAENVQNILQDEQTICEKILSLFDQSPFENVGNLQGLQIRICDLRKEIDYAVNNSVFNRTLNVRILASPGRLLFGIPQILAKRCEFFENIQFLYLIDEIENLSVPQQQFLNTLIRHRKGPCSFRIGARLYGIQTLKTYGSEEENKEGSEFKKIYLDAQLRANPKYDQFVRRLCAKRLIGAGFHRSKRGESDLAEHLDRFFDQSERDRLARRQTLELVHTEKEQLRRYFVRLKKEIEEGIRIGNVSGVGSKDLDELISRLRVDEFPLLEKLNVFLLYQDWYRKKDLRESAIAIQIECRDFVNRSKEKGRYARTFGHFSGDLLAQLYREYKRPLPYVGMETFVKMSAGVPRNLLVILRNIFKWATFNGEKPFEEGKISMRSQQEALVESATFFYEEDARPGTEVPAIREAVDRIAELLRSVRFSSKPVESSPLAFSFSRSQLQPSTWDLVKLAENWSFIFQIPGGRPNKNSQSVDEKFQLNPMLSPKWDLPIYRRGDVAIPVKLMDAMFHKERLEEFRDLLDDYVSGLNAPRFGNGRARKKITSSINQSLDLGLSNDP